MPKKSLPPTLDKLLDAIPNRPDSQIWKKRQYCAKRTRKGLFHFIYDLFMWNEVVTRDRRRTDQSIKEVILAEFPASKHPILRKNLDSDDKGINYYRQLFNTGKLSRGAPPPYVSFRYNITGNRIDTRSGKEMSSKQQKAHMERYRSKFLKKLQTLEAKEAAAQ